MGTPKEAGVSNGSMKQIDGTSPLQSPRSCRHDAIKKALGVFVCEGLHFALSSYCCIFKKEQIQTSRTLDTGTSFWLLI